MSLQTLFTALTNSALFPFVPEDSLPETPADVPTLAVGDAVWFIAPFEDYAGVIIEIDDSVDMVRVRYAALDWFGKPCIDTMWVGYGDVVRRD